MSRGKVGGVTGDNKIFFSCRLTVCLTRTLKLSEDVLGVCPSPSGHVLAVALLDSTVKVFFTDTLKV